MRGSALFAVLALACAAACASLSGLTSGGGDAGDGDAGSDASLEDTGVPDPPEDAQAPDAGSSDAQVDGPAIDGAPRSGFCAQQPSGLTFCTDFDEAPLGADWTNLVVSVDGGQLGILVGDASSPPGALSAVGVPLATSFDAEHVHVDRLFGAAPYVHYAFDVRFDALDTNDQGVEFTSLGFAAPTASSFQIIAHASGWTVGEEQHFADGGSTFTPTAVAGIPVGTWARVTLDVTPPANGTKERTLTVSRDGTVLVSQPILGSFGTVPVHLFLGIVYAHGPSNGIRVSADNVTLRLSDAG